MTNKIHACEILQMLIPTGGWGAYGSEYEDIVFLEATPITKAEYEAGVLAYPAWKAQQDSDKATTRTALLARLGITEEEAALLLGGTN
jgi:hypothetical protein